MRLKFYMSDKQNRFTLILCKVKLKLNSHTKQTYLFIRKFSLNLTQYGYLVQAKTNKYRNLHNLI